MDTTERVAVLSRSRSRFVRDFAVGAVRFFHVDLPSADPTVVPSRAGGENLALNVQRGGWCVGPDAYELGALLDDERRRVRDWGIQTTDAEVGGAQGVAVGSDLPRARFTSAVRRESNVCAAPGCGRIADMQVGQGRGVCDADIPGRGERVCVKPNAGSGQAARRIGDERERTAGVFFDIRDDCATAGEAECFLTTDELKLEWAAGGVYDVESGSWCRGPDAHGAPQIDCAAALVVPL
ncbi:MAG: hypothetical protein U0821_14260 [Chloroflexota bacterium]